MQCKGAAFSTPVHGRWRRAFAAAALSGLINAGAPGEDAEARGERIPEAERDALAAAARPHAHEAGSVTSEDLYRDFRRRFEARGGARRFRIGVAPMRGLTPPGELSCLADVDLLDGAVDVACENLSEPADVYLVDNQAVEGDSVLPEAHDAITRLGRAEPRRGGRARLGADLGADFFADSELDLMVLVRPGGDPTSVDSLVAVGAPSAFMRRFWRETRRGGRGDSGGFGHRRPGRVQRIDPRVRLGLVDQDVLDGADLFFRETFEGNGRTCATCHRAEANLGLDPEFVQTLRRRELRRFRGLKDPLFVAHPRFIGRHPVPELEVPFLLNQQAMIRENVDGFESPAEKFAMRGVPHALSQAPTIAPPAVRADGTRPDGSSVEVVEHTGWSGDGAPVTGALRLFPVGATIQHFRRRFDDQTPGPGNFRLPDDDELDSMERFMLTTGRTSDIDLSRIVLGNEEAEGGRGAFVAGACGLCHANAGAIARADIVDVDLEGMDGDDLGNRNFNTQVERLDTPARRRYLERTGTEMTCDGGFGGQGLGIDGFNFDSDCGLGADTAGDGLDNPDAFGDGRFNAVSVIESADTGPFFHNNAVDTIEEAVEFYRSTAFNSSPAAQRFQIDLSGLSDTAITNVAALLRTLNAGFNLRIAQQRCGAAAGILRDAARTSHRERGETRKLVNRLIELANEELVDARRVLGREDAEIADAALALDPLYPEVRRHIRRVIASNNRLLRVKDIRKRQALAASCRVRTKAAREDLTAEDSEVVLDFAVGAGNLGF